MEPVAPKGQSLRDPFGQESLYVEKLDRLAQTIAFCEADMVEDASPKNRAVCGAMVCDDVVSCVTFGYAKGDDIGDVWVATESALSAAERALALRVGVEGLSPFQPFSFSVARQAMPTYAVFAITACMAPTHASLQRFFSLVMAGDEPEELFDRLARVFEPDRPLASAYPKFRHMSDWTKPVRAALALPAEHRAAGLAAHMKGWQALMRPFGLKSKPKAFYDLFPYFAFDVALAVCAFDIDDSSFRDHPHYPHDLVDHYRTHVRMTRDADRSFGVDPGIQMLQPVQAPRADLAKSKRKGLSRWIELVTTGDVDAVDAVLNKIGKPRKLDDVWGLMCALSEDLEHAIHADIKDDTTVAAQAQTLARKHALGEFVAPEDPPEGPARVTQTLLAFDTWLSARGYRLVGLDNGDDAVHAVMVQAPYLQALLDMSASLRIRANPADQAYAEG